MSPTPNDEEVSKRCPLCGVSKPRDGYRYCGTCVDNGLRPVRLADGGSDPALRAFIGRVPRGDPMSAAHRLCLRCQEPVVEDPRWGWIHADPDLAVDHSCYAPKNTLHDFTAADPNSADCDVCGEGRVHYAHGGAVCSIGYCEERGTEYVGANPWPWCPEHADEFDTPPAPSPEETP